MMETLAFKNNIGKQTYYIKWSVANPKACVIISHGMAEHPIRYDNLANFLNSNGITVYAIHHIGHGMYSPDLGHMDINDMDQCVINLNMLIEIAKKETSVKVFLLGHSMGSFISQIYISRYNNIDGVILSGSTKASLFMQSSFNIMKIVKLFSKDLKKKSPLLDKLTFGAYNKKIKKARTKFDWLSRDNGEVDKYVKDKFCGFIGSKGFFYNLAYATHIMNKKKYIQNVSTNLPILIHGGSADPVSNYKKGLVKLYKQYQKLNVKNIDLIIYQDARHEIYNELNKEEVYQNTLDFINKYL